jgi:pyruvate dehydrogenase E2 component (dihydrolipoamide acetyltransferase)
MPSLGADMEAGTVLEWHVAPGQAVRRGQIVMLVDTDKAEIEAEIWEDGVIEEILVPVGRKVPVGTPLLRLAAAARAPAEPQPGPAPTREQPAGERMPASPHARRLARERGIALGDVRGSGPGGAVRASDLETRAPSAPRETTPAARAPSPPPSPPVALGAERRATMQAAMASAMARSKREIPHFYLEHELDVSRTLAWLEAENARRPVAERLLLGVLLVKATALALVRVPELNGHYLDGAFRPGSGIHVGVAIAVRGGGLLAPALLDAERKPLGQLMGELRDLVARARRARLRGAEANAATITVTSLGDLGVDKVFGVIQPPQVALLGFGAVRERPWAEHGLLGVRPVVSATLAADHRVSDGLRGARLLTTIEKLLSQPESL